MDIYLHPERTRLPYRAVRKLAPLALLLVCLSLPSTALATIYRVGVGAACTHPNITAAIAAAVADGSPGSHVIRVRSGLSTSNNLNIENPLRDITIHGGFANCEDNEPAPGNRTNLRANATGNRVLRVLNNNSNPRRTITLRNVSVTNGRAPTTSLQFGGGILAQGRVTLVLDEDTRVEDNQAISGGGIALVNLTGDSDLFTQLQVRGGSRICENIATGAGANGRGGGILAGGGTVVGLDDVDICDNEARRAGGGVALLGVADTLALGPTGQQTVSFTNNLAGNPTFNANEGFGGGVYRVRGDIIYSNNATPATRLGSVVFTNNRANFGGGIYVLGADTSGQGFATVELRNVVFHSNRAEATGAGIHLQNAVDARIIKWGDGACIFGGPSLCVDVWANHALNQGGSDSFGAGGFAFLNHEPEASRPALRIAGALFEQNNDINGTAAVIEARGNSSVRILRSVFLGNTAGGDPTFSAMLESRNNTLFAFNTVLGNNVTRLFFQGQDSEIDVTGSILYSPGVAIRGGQGTLVHNNCLLSHTTGGMPPGVLVAPPNLGASWTPRPSSPAVDYCANGVGDNFWPSNRDAYRTVAPINVPGVVNVAGTFDLGAVELADAIFYGGFGVRPTN